MFVVVSMNILRLNQQSSEWTTNFVNYQKKYEKSYENTNKVQI